MEFIKTFSQVISPNLCEVLIEHYLNNYSETSRLQYPIENPPNRELTLTGLKDSLIDRLEDNLKVIGQSKLSEYLGGTKYENKDLYFYNHLSLMHYTNTSSKPYHFDSEFDYKDDSELLRLFAILIYLNDDFEGGELMFPLQSKVIKPEVGKLVVFPTSFMFPHLTIPAFGKDRMVLRMHYYVCKDKL